LKRIILPVFVIFITGSIFWSVTFLSILNTPDRVIVENKVGDYIQKGEMGYTAILKPNSIYGKTIIDKQDGVAIFTKILKEFQVDYSYSVSGVENITGKYTLKTFLRPTESRNAPVWTKELHYISRGSFSGSKWTKTFTIDWDYIMNLWNQIQEETGYRYGNPEVIIDIRTDINGYVGDQTIHANFSHVIPIVHDSSLIFDNLEKQEKKSVLKKKEVENTVEIFGFFKIQSNNAKKLSAGFSICFISVSLLMGYKTRHSFRSAFKEYKKKRKLNEFRKKYGNIVVEVDTVENGTFTLKNFKDLGKLAVELEKPILETEEDYRVIDGYKIYKINKFKKENI
jgi:hypothetical protein